MRNTDLQLQEILKRAEIVREKRSIRRRIRADALAACMCCGLLAVVSFWLPRLGMISAADTERRYGSLLLATPYMGYVAVSVLAFALGVFVTLLCVHWKRLDRRERENK